MFLNTTAYSFQNQSTISLRFRVFKYFPYLLLSKFCLKLENPTRPQNPIHGIT